MGVFNVETQGGREMNFLKIAYWVMGLTLIGVALASAEAVSSQCLNCVQENNSLKCECYFTLGENTSVGNQSFLATVSDNAQGFLSYLRTLCQPLWVSVVVFAILFVILIAALVTGHWLLFLFLLALLVMATVGTNYVGCYGRLW
jgi:hypothetical protein